MLLNFKISPLLVSILRMRFPVINLVKSVSKISFLDPFILLEPYFKATNSIPGKAKTLFPSTCCDFDFQKKIRSSTFEPIFTEIGDDEKFNFMTAGKALKNLRICKDSAKKMATVLEKMREVTDFKGLEFYRIDDEKWNALGENYCFMGISNDILGVSLDGWVFPLIMSFNTTNDSFDTKLNIIWEFLVFDCVPELDGYKPKNSDIGWFIGTQKLLKSTFLTENTENAIPIDKSENQAKEEAGDPEIRNFHYVVDIYEKKILDLNAVYNKVFEIIKIDKDRLFFNTIIPQDPVQQEKKTANVRIPFKECCVKLETKQKDHKWDTVLSSAIFLIHLNLIILVLSLIFASSTLLKESDYSSIKIYLYAFLVASPVLLGFIFKNLLTTKSN